VAYLPLGDPAVPWDAASAYAQEGVDVLEIGVPAPNPALDGPTVVASMERALAAGVDARRASQLIHELRERLPEQAMVWMSYPRAIADGWLAAVLASGADGVLLPGWTDESAGAGANGWLAAALAREDVAVARFLGAPLDERELDAAVRARGYVMVQARPGVTGPGEPAPGLTDELRALRVRGVRVPIAVGFGVREPDDARRVARLGADAVVVGSAAVEAALAGESRLRAFLRSMREALDAV
jgi:tryptophan synthase alpha chain